jgi:hypothetical protein
MSKHGIVKAKFLELFYDSSIQNIMINVINMKFVFDKFSPYQNIIT